MIRAFLFSSFALLVVLFSVQSDAQAAIYPLSPAVELQMQAGIDDVIEQRYEDAFKRADTIAQLSQGPEAWALRALILQGWIIDYESFDRVNEFTAACDSTESRALLLKADYPGFVNFTIGLIDGFRATIASRQEKWITAMRAAISMKSELESAKTADSTLTACYIGLGSFDYWSSRKLSYLPFLGDYRTRGIERLQLVLRSNRLYESSAATALLWIYIDQGKYDEALAIAAGQLKKYPEARSFMWAAAEAAYAAHYWKVGIEYYLKILASVRSDSNQNNHLNEMGCYHRLAEMSMKNGDMNAAKVYVRQGLSLSLTPDIRARKKRDLADFYRWWKEWTGKPYHD